MTTIDCEGAGPLSVRDTATELYQLAALMMGDELKAADLAETAIAQTKIDPCAQPHASMEAARVNLVEMGVTRLNETDPMAFEVPALSISHAGGCIEDDDLSSAGISADQLKSILNGGGRHSFRDWLEKLSIAQRAIFVERAVLGWDNAAAAVSLTKTTGCKWQPAQVSELFRQALCSLATSLVHAAAVQA